MYQTISSHFMFYLFYLFLQKQIYHLSCSPSGPRVPREWSQPSQDPIRTPIWGLQEVISGYPTSWN